MAAKGGCVAVLDAHFRFHGRTAHAGGSPHLGRSALDAVELMNVGVNYLREHVLPDVRMHYVITKGGEAPNIVPDLAEVWYFLRAHQPDELEEVVRRVRKVAEGAALMTETTVEEIFGSSCANVLSNHYLADLQYAAMQLVGDIAFTPEEIAFAQQVNAAYPAEMFTDSVKYLCEKLKVPEEIARQPLIAQNLPATDENEVSGGSTDVGDMSWCVPLSELGTTCFTSATPGHSWGNVATGGMSIGHKGMLHAAKIMAVAAIDCYTDPVHIQKARAEFDAAIKKHPYRSLIPADAKPYIAPDTPADALPTRFPQFPLYKS
jgi:aminobenzoyl-glutamate utilization protein B